MMYKDKYGVNMSVTMANKILHLHFHGTTGFWQWVTNFFAWPFMIRKPYKDMDKEAIWYAHWGFFKAFKAKKNTVKILIDDKYLITEAVSITGHSKGGAVAHYCAEWINYNYKNLPLKARTTGAPKSVCKMGQFLMEAHGIDIVNIENGNDIVTKSPPWFVRPGSIKHIGPKRRPFILSIKDHKGY